VTAILYRPQLLFTDRWCRTFFSKPINLQNT